MHGPRLEGRARGEARSGPSPECEARTGQRLEDEAKPGPRMNFSSSDEVQLVCRDENLQCGNVATWQRDNVAMWQRDNLATWQRGNVAIWLMSRIYGDCSLRSAQTNHSFVIYVALELV
jgi:hypothetical protein